ncbi:MAG: DUF5615 family PIN-like protein [Deltaproteobacteria bacterium]|nr:DUF5615 family PIN-like protein [Deltaproteobacteria bacterium]
MDFLLNMNVPRGLAKRLSAIGHRGRHAGDLGLHQATDTEIVALAKSTGEVIITHDLDYGTLLAFSGEASPSVIIFRLRNTIIEHLFTQIRGAWPDIETPLKTGAIVLIEEAVVRIRRLPISR